MVAGVIAGRSGLGTEAMGKNYDVAVIGAGLIGRSWAMVFARAGWTVRVTDSSAAALKAVPRLVRASLADLTRHGLVADPRGVAKRIIPVRTIEEAASGADFAQECGPETVADKIGRASCRERVFRTV